MKLVTLLIPAYMPRPYAGATPTPYQSGTVDAFEKALVALTDVVIRHPNANRLTPDVGGRWVSQEIVTPYQVEADRQSIGEAIGLALKTFKLGEITVLSNDGSESFSVDAAQELATGIHPWNEEA